MVHERIVLLESFKRRSKWDCEGFVVCDKLACYVYIRELPALWSLRETDIRGLKSMLTALAELRGNAVLVSQEPQ